MFLLADQKGSESLVSTGCALQQVTESLSLALSVLSVRSQKAQHTHLPLIQLTLLRCQLLPGLLLRCLLFAQLILTLCKLLAVLLHRKLLGI